MKDTVLGVIRYDKNGKPICEVCGKSFNKLMTHTRQKHDLKAIEYKKMFGLDIGKGIMSQTSKELARQRVFENKECIDYNLLQRGKKTRFKNGCKGRTKDKISQQTLIVLKQKK